MIGTVIFTACGLVFIILAVKLFQYGPGRALVRMLCWLANQAAAIARGADEYVAGYHAHLDLYRLEPAKLQEADSRKICTSEPEDTLVALYGRRLHLR